MSHGLAPLIIGWLGIVTGISFGVGNTIKLVIRRFNILLFIGGMPAMLFEVLLGGWLLFSPIIQ